jgi:hypothetical protein
MWLVGLEIFGACHTEPAGAFARNTKILNTSSAISVIGEYIFSSDHGGHDFNPHPGRIRHGNEGDMRSKNFVGEVLGGHEESQPPRRDVRV